MAAGGGGFGGACFGSGGGLEGVGVGFGVVFARRASRPVKSFFGAEAEGGGVGAITLGAAFASCFFAGSRGGDLAAVTRSGDLLLSAWPPRGDLGRPATPTPRLPQPERHAPPSAIAPSLRAPPIEPLHCTEILPAAPF